MKWSIDAKTHRKILACVREKDRQTIERTNSHNLYFVQTDRILLLHAKFTQDAHFISLNCGNFLSFSPFFFPKSILILNNHLYLLRLHEWQTQQTHFVFAPHSPTTTTTIDERTSFGNFEWGSSRYVHSSISTDIIVAVNAFVSLNVDSAHCLVCVLPFWCCRFAWFHI